MVGREGEANFEKLRARVRILTNSPGSTDAGTVHANCSKYPKYLLHAGVELDEIDKVLSKQ